MLLLSHHENRQPQYKPCIFGDLCIKGTTLACNDFGYQSIVDAIDHRDSGGFAALLDESQSTGKSIPMDFDSIGRDGCFDDDQWFAVFERADVMYLINRLDAALGDAAAGNENPLFKAAYPAVIASSSPAASAAVRGQ